MRSAYKVLFLMLFIISLVLGIQGAFAADNQLLVKVIPFPVTPGESIVGIEYTVTNGKITHVTRPRGWSCRTINNARDKQVYFDCSSTHRTYGLTNAARLPILSLEEASGNCRIEALVKFENNSGQRDTKKLIESDFSITR